MNTPIHPRQIYEAQNGLCFHCGKQMDTWAHVQWIKHGHNGWTREHFIPKFHLNKMKGEIKYNIVLAHQHCNAKRGSRFPTQQEVIKFHQIYQRIL